MKPKGTRGEARLNVIRLIPRAVSDGRVYFCGHVTPELIWRREWQAPQNGALAIARVAIASRDPGRVAQMFDHMFGDNGRLRYLMMGQQRCHVTFAP